MRLRTLSDVSFYLAAVLFACATDAAAATRTWVGGAGEFWSTPANWQGGNVPGNGDDVVINVGAATTSRNDLNDLHLNSIVLDGQVHLLGIAFGLGAGGLHVVGGPPMVQIRILLDADQVWTIAGAPVTFTTADFGLEPNVIELSGHTLTLDISGTMTVVTRIAGAGALVKNGVGSLWTSGLDIYTGVTTINKGIFIAMGPLGVEDGTHANGTVVNAGGTLDIHCGSNEALSLAGAGVGGVTVLGFNGEFGIICEINGPITLASDVVLNLFNGFVHPPRLDGPISGPGRLGLDNMGGLWLANSTNTFAGVTFGVGGPPASTLRVGANNALPTTLAFEIPAGATLDLFGNAQTLASLSGAGTLTSPSFATVGLTLNGAGATTFSGPITSTPITYMGAGHQTFGGISNSTLSVQSGLVTIAGGSFSQGVGVGSGGRLSLTANGQAGPLNVNGGQLLLSEGGAALGRSGNVLVSAGSVEIGGSLAGALGRLNTTGTVSLHNSTLALSLPAGFTTPVRTTFTIIDNDGTDPIGGTFTGLPEGGLAPVADRTFQISYVGGDGNDVTLTSVPPAVDYLLTEGATGGFFNTDLLLANPNDQAASIRITFLRERASNIVVNDTLPAKSHKRIPVQNIEGMESTAFSTVVRSVVGLPLIVERTMSWDSTGYAAHTEHATTGAATTWYFAEGSQGFFHTYLLLSNPNASKTKATVQYLREFETALTREYDVEPGSRFTVDASADPELVNRSFAMAVTFDQPAAAERAMYFGDAPLFKGGHGSAGVTAPSTTWFLAEGATGPFFETFILLANPGETEAEVTLTYLPATGSPITANRNVPARGRVTVNLEGEDPTLTNAPVSTQVVSTQPILVERSQYWPDPAPTWYEAHNSFGVTSLDTKWGLAEGRVGGANNAQTYILLVNPGTAAANVEITFLRADGATPVTKTFTVNPTSRFNVTVGPGTPVPEIANETFGARIISDQPIAVERALYWDANGQTWAAGTNATASRLP